MYFASAVVAIERGYHVPLFDGPGQGETLYEHGIRLRPDWETVVRAVVDFAVSPDRRRWEDRAERLEPGRVPRSARGIGRAAAVAALIADPPQWSIADGVRRPGARRKPQR